MKKFHSDPDGKWIVKYTDGTYTYHHGVFVSGNANWLSVSDANGDTTGIINSPYWVVAYDASVDDEPESE